MRPPNRHLRSARLPLNKAREHHRRLMVMQSNVPWRDRVYFSRRENRFWKWSNDGLMWAMRDTTTGELFGPVFDRVTFSDKGYTARHASPRRKHRVPSMEINFDADPPKGFRSWSPNPGVHPHGKVGGFVGWASKNECIAKDREAREKFLGGDWGVASPPFTVAGSRTGRFPSTTEKTMTTLKLSILLWRAAHATAPYMGAACGYISPFAIATAIRELKAEGLAASTVDGYELTDKARVFIAHLLKQPLPIQTKPEWKMPADGGVVTGV